MTKNANAKKDNHNDKDIYSSTLNMTIKAGDAT